MKRRTLFSIVRVWLFAVASCAAPARADIYQWAWVDPNDQSEGKYQSFDALPGRGRRVGSAERISKQQGLDAGVSHQREYRLRLGVLCQSASADLSNANATAANFYYATLTNATLTGPNLSSANLGGARIATLTGANLSSANLYYAKLTGADLTGATVASALTSVTPPTTASRPPSFTARAATKPRTWDPSAWRLTT